MVALSWRVFKTDLMATSTNHYLNDNVSCVARMQTGYIISNIAILHILQVKSCDNLADLFTKSLPNSTFQKCVHGIGRWRLRILQESGGVSFWIVPVQCIILYSFSLHEFTLQVLIKVFNEVISTWDHMSYFLFSPPGFLGKYIRHIYCPLNSMGFLVLS